MRLMFSTLAKQRLRYKGFLIFFLAAAVVVSVANVFTMRFIGEMGQAAIDFQIDTLLRYFAFITGLIIIRAAASAASAFYLGRFAGKAGYRFRDNFAKYFLRKPFASFEETKGGETLSIFSNDLPASVELVSNGGIRMIADVISLVAAFAYMFYLNWWLTLIFIASFPLLVAMQVLIAVPIQKKNEHVLKARANFNSVANDSFQNTSTVAAYSLEGVMVNRCLAAIKDWIAAEKSMAKSFIFLVMAGIFASVSPLYIVIAVSAQQVIAGAMVFAEWLAYINLASEASGWLSMLSQRQNQIQTAAAGAKRLSEHTTGEPEDIDAGSELKPRGDIAVAAQNLSFSYKTDEDAPLALDGVSFEIKRGSRVAFVGGSGSGKSTVLKLLLGLYTPKEGKITVTGTETGGVSLKSLRDVYAYVPQDSFLFPESIGENVTGEPDIKDLPRLEKACADAGILEFINSLPGGFGANLSESAENVSGGQKQRIALARAFYRDAPIILFDEATSSLDPVTEAAVLQSFDSLAKDKTVVMVAHRPGVIKFCDTIIVMDGGRVAASGTHEELLESCPAYASLHSAKTEVRQ